MEQTEGSETLAYKIQRLGNGTRRKFEIKKTTFVSHLWTTIWMKLSQRQVSRFVVSRFL